MCRASSDGGRRCPGESAPAETPQRGVHNNFAEDTYSSGDGEPVVGNVVAQTDAQRAERAATRAEARKARDRSRELRGQNPSAAPQPTQDNDYIQPTPEELAKYQASLAAERAEKDARANGPQAGARYVENNYGPRSQGNNSPVYNEYPPRDDR